MKLENNLFILNVWYNIPQMGDIFMGKTVIIDGKKGYLAVEEYFKDDINTLIIEEGVKEIGIRAFAQNNLTNLIIPKSITKIFIGAFKGNPITELTLYNNGILPYISDYNFLDVLTVNVINGNYDFLEQFFRYIEICNDNFKKLESIILVNDKLTFSEKIKIRKLSMIKRIQIRFATNITRFNVVEEDSAQEISVDEEVNNLLEEINLLSKGLDEQSNNIIQMKVTKLLDDYKKDLLSLKPNYYEKESVLTLECTSPRDLRNSLIISLNNVIMLLNSRKKTLNLSSKIVQYNKFINNEETSFELEEDNNFNKISRIKNISKLFENKYIVSLVTKLLLDTKEFINTNLNNMFNDKLDLTNLDIVSYFNIELDKIYQKTLLTLPYKNLLMSLQLQGDSNLANVLKDLNIIFTTINNKTNNKTIDSLFNKYHQQLVKKYIDIIKDNVSNIFYDEECISANQIETNFRQELNLILVELNKELPKILENQELLNDISLAKEYMEYEFSEDDNWLISIIKEILNLTNNNLLDDATVKHINTRLRNLVGQWYLSLSNKSINSIVESLYNNYGLTSNILVIKTKIISDFYEVKREVESYLARLKEYNKYSSLIVNKDSNNTYSYVSGLIENNSNYSKGLSKNYKFSTKDMILTFKR